MPLKDKQKRAEYQRNWRKQNPEKELSRRQRYYTKNKQKLSERLKDYYQRNTDKKKARYRKSTEYQRVKKYGITPEQFATLLERQGNKCACCGISTPNHNKGWCVDHDHVTGQVRGILCHKCNVGIGALGDTISRIENALRYLQRAYANEDKNMNHYEPQNLALQIFQDRHAAHPNETWMEACIRVASHVANAESGEARNDWKERFYQALATNAFMPGGRIWYGSGRARGQLLNCFVTGAGDSREAWGKTVSDSIVIAGTGGGVGVNCSPVRPRGTPIRGTGGVATGAVSLMEIINAAGEVIKAGGGRRTALMLCLGISHGDITEFLDAKLDKGRLNNANVSVVFDDDPEIFFEFVRNNGSWPLVHAGREVGAIPARVLWDRIVRNALAGGEPGILNGYLANRMSNIWYVEPLTSTNPCGEIWLSPYDCCCLGALVLPRFVVKGEVNWVALEETVKTGIRFLDDVLTVNNYPLSEIQEKCFRYRRIGLGVTGLHHMLLELGLKYNAPSGLEFVDKLMKRIANWSYEASSDIAAEKGSFAAFDADKFLRSGFCKTLKPSLREKIRRDGMRNCAVNTIAPTGTISIVCDVSSGIEPIFAAAYERRYRKGDDIAMEVVVDPMFQRFVSDGRNVKHFVGAHDISMRDHMEMQRVCQKHVDNAVSKTINLPHGTSADELSDLYMEFLPELKGVTVYPDGSRENQPLTPLPLDRAIELARESKAETFEVKCAKGSCDL